MNLILLYPGALRVAVGAVLSLRLDGRATATSGDLDTPGRRLVAWSMALVTTSLLMVAASPVTL